MLRCRYIIEKLKNLTPDAATKVEWINIWGLLEKFVDWQQWAPVMQREAVTVMPSCNSGGNAVVAWSSSL
jgi:hypothetical protein